MTKSPAAEMSVQAPDSRRGVVLPVLRRKRAPGDTGVADFQLSSGRLSWQMPDADRGNGHRAQTKRQAAFRRLTALSHQIHR